MQHLEEQNEKLQKQLEDAKKTIEKEKNAKKAANLTLATQKKDAMKR